MSDTCRAAVRTRGAQQRPGYTGGDGASCRARPATGTWRRRGKSSGAAPRSIARGARTTAAAPPVVTGRLLGPPPGQRTEKPASSGRLMPVTNFASSDTSQATELAMSSGCRIWIGSAFCIALTASPP
ncbi:MAG: hypothetical protein QOJ30_5153 [Pseudonocardiales bacterium]|nr:hypothetical protein [Pseudonocardiales bacterium]